MLEIGARFTEDLYINVSFDPDNNEGFVTAIFGRGEEKDIKSGVFNLSGDIH